MPDDLPDGMSISNLITQSNFIHPTWWLVDTRDVIQIYRRMEDLGHLQAGRGLPFLTVLSMVFE